MEKIRGQGATEYLMIFAGVLLIAMTAVVVLGFFPAFAGDAAITTSNTYWRNEARPFAILEHSAFASNGTFYVKVENSGVEKMTVTDILLGCNAEAKPTEEIAPGENKIIPIESENKATAGDLYECDVTIAYLTKNQLPMTEYGDEKLVGRYV
ncbi:MAG: hypothetical protein NTV88_06255 [Candidatus Micrarchaeota archaeon]|nr:hypothetical protein [Candidatus Micrarchaeota archaeon]